MFTWVPIYKELANKLLEYRNRQPELLEILQEMQNTGLTTIRLKDTAKGNKTIPLGAIDPFTFFANFNRQLTDDKRQNLLAVIKEKLQLGEPIPQDFTGIPVKPATKSWFFAWEKNRNDGDIDALWDLAEAIVTKDPSDIPAKLFKRANDVEQAGISSLTMGMFWMRPDTYLPLDGNTRAALEKRGISTDVEEWPSYLSMLTAVKSQVAEPFYEFSAKAYDEVHTPSNYWLFQASPAYFDTPGALQAGAVEA